ncbi:hypothetical protein ACX8Z9_12620 [Arthrobacter halodurans]|uniref:PknH-like extracellular domain-containing protein n=1 Tax=Arthrobacter halodurans TaxID=516699 RepID=A0ABV4UM72_9MICC
MGADPNRTRRPRARARRPLTVAVAVAAALAIAGCSAPDGPDAGDPHAGVDTGTTAAPASPEAAGTAVQAAVDGGIAQAGRYGFTLTAPASAADLGALRSAPADALEGVVVIPSTCAEPVEALNWSPALLGPDSARTDFAADGVDATGSVEVAAVSDSDRGGLDAHYATVEAMLGDCRRMTLNIQSEGESGGVVPETVQLKSTAPEVADDAADSALLWTRAAETSGLRQQALVLIKERGGHVAMVSFIGRSLPDEEKFATMAATILDAALSALPG